MLDVPVRQAAARIERALEAFGLPTRVPRGVSSDGLIAAMRRDKKALDGLTFVSSTVNVADGMAREASSAVTAAVKAGSQRGTKRQGP